jgi:hypothetical protein
MKDCDRVKHDGFRILAREIVSANRAAPLRALRPRRSSGHISDLARLPI